MLEQNQPGAPLPRDYDRATFSEFIPFRSKKIKLWRSPIFWFVILTALLNVVLFVARDNTMGAQNAQDAADHFAFFVKMSMVYMLGLALFGFHAYARSDKPILFYAFPIAVVLFLLSGPFFLYYGLFQALAGGPTIDDNSVAWSARFWAAFAGPGLREEFTKAVPALIGAALTVLAAQLRWMPRWFYNTFRVRGPLDGVLMGFAAGIGFLFFETSGQYISQALAEAAKSGHDPQGAMGAALLLLLPRVANGWVGHSAWAAITGYGIGLAVIRPKSAWLIIPGVYLTAAALHGAWDSGLGYGALYFIGGASGILGVACLMKARQLEASLFGRSSATFGSIVVGAPPPPAAAAPVPAYAPHPPAAPVPAYAPQPAYRAPAPASPPPAAPAVVPAAAPARAATRDLLLTIDGLRLPLSRGRVIDFGAEPGLAGRGQGVRAEVTQHPTKPDVLGLRNLGTGTWYARLRDGTLQAVEGQRSLRLAPGVSVDFGGGLVAQVAAD